LSSQGETSPYPVVIMTSYGDEQIAVEAMKAGALDYIVKSPTSLAEFPRIAERTFREWDHIRARKQAEEAARQAASELRAFIETAPQGVLVIDRDGLITLVNKKLEHIFGYDREELIGQPAALLLPYTGNGVLHEEGAADHEAGLI